MNSEAGSTGDENFINIRMDKSVVGYLTLHKSLSPVLLPVLFWLLSLAGVWGGFRLITTGGPVLGLLVIVISICLARILCESLNQLFVISDELKKMSER